MFKVGDKLYHKDAYNRQPYSRYGIVTAVHSDHYDVDVYQIGTNRMIDQVEPPFIIEEKYYAIKEPNDLLKEMVWK
jgi:hypothetical protein